MRSAVQMELFSPKIGKFFKTAVLTLGIDILTAELRLNTTFLTKGLPLQTLVVENCKQNYGRYARSKQPGMATPWRNLFRGEWGIGLDQHRFSLIWLFSPLWFCLEIFVASCSFLVGLFASVVIACGSQTYYVRGVTQPKTGQNASGSEHKSRWFWKQDHWPAGKWS